MNNLRIGSTSGYRYVEDPYRHAGSDYSGLEKLQVTRPMVNSLVLKNDEAGIDGIKLMCSNMPKDPKFATLRDVEGELETACTNNEEHVCSKDMVNVEGMGMIDDGTVINSTVGASVSTKPITKCELREFTEQECSENALGNFEKINDANRAKGCFLADGTTYFNEGGDEDLPVLKVCLKSSTGKRDAGYHRCSAAPNSKWNPSTPRPCTIP